LGVRPNQIDNWKKQLLDRAAKAFEAGGSADGTIGEAEVDVLHRQTGQLVETIFGTKARQMSRAERRALVERENPTLPVSQQCPLLAVFRSPAYRRPAEVSEVDRIIMGLIDRQYLARPYYGSRRMARPRAT